MLLIKKIFITPKFKEETSEERQQQGVIAGSTGFAQCQEESFFLGASDSRTLRQIKFTYIRLSEPKLKSSYGGSCLQLSVNIFWL